MAFRAFIHTHVFEKQSASKEKSKSSIQCIECYDRNVYIGTKDATVQHLLLASSTNHDLSPGESRIREGRARKLGSSNYVSQLRAVPLFNHLLVLWERSIMALNMFSLEPVAALKKIQHVSLFEVCDSSAKAGCVEMVTSSSRRKVIRVHVVGVDSWEVVKEVNLNQDPVALAVNGASVCVATSDRYLLCNVQSGSRQELFPHNHSREHVVVSSVGRGEFLLNGPGFLGVFVMETGICQRPPLQWPQEVLAAGVCFPYILTLQPQMLSVYSMLDQQRKQTVSLNGAKGLLSIPDGALVFTERDIICLSLVPFEEQIQALVGPERFEEALLLLEGVQSHQPLHSYKELQKAITCLAGFAHFYQKGFSMARDLFIKGELDPREIILLYPDMQLCVSGDFQSGLDQVNKCRDLQVLWQEDFNTFHHYLEFLRGFLTAVRETEPGLQCRKEVDSALLRLYVRLEEWEKLLEFVAYPNECCLELCGSVLEQNHRFFALGFLYESHGMETEAIQTWMKITDGFLKDPTCSDVYGHIVKTLSQLRNKDTVWASADWTLQKKQEVFFFSFFHILMLSTKLQRAELLNIALAKKLPTVSSHHPTYKQTFDCESKKLYLTKTGVQIFTQRPPDHRFEPADVLPLLEKYPLALLFYLEFLIYKLNSEEERYHNRLALAYVTQTLREEEGRGSDVRETRDKLQQLLWESKCYDISTVYDNVKSTTLHSEKAILLGRAGEHFQALQMLVHEEKDPQAAEAYCCRAARGLESELMQTLLLTLLQIYLSSEDLVCAAVDLLNNHPQVFPVEKVIQLLPESWSLQLVSQFLVRTFREAFHQRQMARLHKALARAELLKHKVIWTQASKTMFRVDKEQKCRVCEKELAESQFACNLRGEQLHIGCSGSSGL